MEYREEPPPATLAGLVKARWQLAGYGGPDERLTHVATPDGCIELIWRTAGRSWWGDEQPAAFVAGLITVPTPFTLSGDACFAALRIWPWAWCALNGTAMLNGWRDMDTALQSPDHVLPALARLPSDPIGGAVLEAATVADLCAATGRPHRWLQRWFAHHVGLPPRTYLRLLRFQEALAGLQADHGSLADHAAAYGFADQPHMAREFRAMSGMPARVARTRARGPFVQDHSGPPRDAN